MKSSHLSVLIVSAVACGSHDGTDAGDIAAGSRKRLFQFRNGTLGKIRDSNDPRPVLEVADAQCTQGAVDQGLGGQWKAWLSTSTVDAADRLEEVGPWYRVDGATKIFESRALIRNGPLAPINAEPSARNQFWSGTLIDGTRSSYLCSDWTEYVFPLKGTVGNADATGAAWATADPIDCGNYLALLCIEQ